MSLQHGYAHDSASRSALGYPNGFKLKGARVHQLPYRVPKLGLTVDLGRKATPRGRIVVVGESRKDIHERAEYKATRLQRGWEESREIKGASSRSPQQSATRSQIMGTVESRLANGDYDWGPALRREELRKNKRRLELALRRPSVKEPWSFILQDLVTRAMCTLGLSDHCDAFA